MSNAFKESWNLVGDTAKSAKTIITTSSDVVVEGVSIVKMGMVGASSIASNAVATLVEESTTTRTMASTVNKVKLKVAKSLEKDEDFEKSIFETFKAQAIADVKE